MPRHRSHLLTTALLVLTLLAAACTSDSGSTSTSSPASSSTTEPVQTVELRYGFSAGDSYTYSLDMSEHVVLDTQGAASAVTDQQIPGSADVQIDATGTFVYTVADGTDPDTYQISIEGDFSDVKVSGTADGRDVTQPSDLPGLGDLSPVSKTIVVDRRGQVLDQSKSPQDLFGLGGTPLAGLSGDLGQFVGPVLPADPVTKGESWKLEYSDPDLGDEPVDVSTTATLTGTEAIDGVETLVIDSETKTGRGTVDLADFFRGFLGAFGGGSTPDATTLPDLDQLVFRIITDPSNGNSKSWFDPARGLVVRSTSSGPTSLTMEVTLPDDNGDLNQFTMNLDTSQTLEYRLVDTGPG